MIPIRGEKLSNSNTLSQKKCTTNAIWKKTLTGKNHGTLRLCLVQQVRNGPGQLNNDFIGSKTNLCFLPSLRHRQARIKGKGKLPEEKGPVAEREICVWQSSYLSLLVGETKLT